MFFALQACLDEFPNPTSELMQQHFSALMKQNVVLLWPQSLFYVLMCLQKERPNYEQEYCIFFSRQMPFEESSGKVSCILLLTLLSFSITSFFSCLPNNLFFFFCVLYSEGSGGVCNDIVSVKLFYPTSMKVTALCFKSHSAPSEYICRFLHGYWKGKSLWEWLVRTSPMG